MTGVQLLPSASAQGKGAKQKGSQASQKEDHWFATAGEKGVVKVWSALQGKCIGEQAALGTIEEGSELTSLERGQDGNLMSATQDGRIAIIAISVIFWQFAFSKCMGLILGIQLYGNALCTIKQCKICQRKYLKVSDSFSPCLLAFASEAVPVYAYLMYLWPQSSLSWNRYKSS